MLISSMFFCVNFIFFFFSSRRRHTRWNCDWSSDVCSSDLARAYALEAHGERAFPFRCQGLGVPFALDTRQPLDLARMGGAQSLDLESALSCDNARQSFGKPLSARGEHVTISSDALRPGVEIAQQKTQVAVVLQPFLKIMTRQQLREVAALGRIRRLAHAPEPSRFFSRVVAQKVLDQRPATNRRDCLIEPCDLARVGIERSFITRERLAVRTELSQRKRYGEQRFLHRRVRHGTVG